jgi:geranylgeranyl diphosphate synthase type II
VGSDIKKGKKTFPSFYGLEESRRRAVEVVDKAVTALKDFDGRPTRSGSWRSTS